MSDRTSVTLRILERDFKAHSELLDHYDEKADASYMYQFDY